MGVFKRACVSKYCVSDAENRGKPKFENGY